MPAVTVYVIAPAQIKALRRRYGTAGNKDDRFDAYVLADTVRTDRRRLTPLLRDAEATIALRQLCRARKDLIAHRVAVANQLRAHLSVAVGLFTTIDLLVSRQFLPRTHGSALAQITQAYVATLAAIHEQINTLTKQITAALDAHPDKHIFASLPKAGAVRAARLLAEIRDARGRFPTDTSLACLSGMAPSTRESGSHGVVSFRWSADKQLRDAVADFAGDSHNADPWAADPHAVRILGRAWIDIIGRCWTNHTPYDPTQHRALQRLQQDQKREA